MEALKREEFEAKIIGDGEKKRFFSSLAEALKAFLIGEVGQLTILGGGISCSFSSWRATVRRQKQGEFDEFFIQAPVVPLLFCRNTGEPPAFTLDVEFEWFFNQLNQGIQIYEQKCRNPDSKGSQVFINYTVNFDWDEQDPRKILLHLHNSDIAEKGFWRVDFYHRRDGDGVFSLAPVFGPNKTVHQFSNN